MAERITEGMAKHIIYGMCNAIKTEISELSHIAIPQEPHGRAGLKPHDDRSYMRKKLRQFAREQFE